MQVNNFDEALRQRFDAYEPPYNPTAWEQLARKLPSPKPSRKLILWPVAIGLAASAAAACIMVFRPASPTYSTEGEIARKASISTTVQSPESHPDAIQKPVGSGAAGTRLIAHHTIYTPPPTSVSVVPAASHDTQSIVPQAHLADNSLQQHAGKISVLSVSGPVVNRETIENLNQSENQRAEARTTISLAGGVQYGSLNTGYTAGVQVRHNLGSRWYVETEIGYLSYASSGTQRMASADVAMIGKTGLNVSDGKTKSQPLVQYIQAAPAVGFQVTKGISVGAGVDLQRALQDSEMEPVRVDGEDVKLLPIFDIGATGRLTFRVSRHLEAGIQYRQGINNFLQSGSSYFDRQYIQVQLKIPLLRR